MRAPLRRAPQLYQIDAQEHVHAARHVWCTQSKVYTGGWQMQACHTKVPGIVLHTISLDNVDDRAPNASMKRVVTAVVLAILQQRIQL